MTSPASDSSATPPTTVERSPAGRSFWLLAAAFALVMSFMTVPTPLYGLYQQRDGFGTFTVTLVFAAYGLGVILGLILSGHVSDHVGRRPVIAAVVALEVVCAVLFPIFPGTAGLLVLRLLTGLGVGALTATVTAHLTELHDLWRPDSDGVLGRTVATSVNVGGLAIGPLVAALLSEITAPLSLPYHAYAVAMLLALPVVWAAPETVSPERVAERWRYRPQRVGVDAEARPAFVGAAVAALAGFAVLGFVTGLTGRFLTDTLDITSRLAVGGVATTVVAGSAVSQVVFAGLPRRAQLRLGAGLVVLGMVLVALAALLAALALFVLGGVLATGGVGLVFAASVATVAGLAAPDRRGETLAALFLAAYVGITVPVVLIGVALTFAGTVPVLVGFAALVLVAVPCGIALLLRRTA